MKRNFALCVAALAATLTTTGTAFADPAAWQVRGAQGNEVVLLGSVHYLRDTDYPLPGLVDTLYGRADRLVMELDLDDLDPLAMQTSLLRAAMLPSGSSLPDVLGPRLYRTAERHADELGFDLATLDGFQPWLVAVTLLDVGMNRLGYRAERGVEQHLLARALRDDKPISGLETMETQISVFESLSQREQQAFLEQTLNELDTADSIMDEMVAAWREGQLESLAASLMSEFTDFPRLYEALVKERNNAWVARVESLLQDDSNYLVVVGALHLVGEDSLIDLLEARGLTVSTID